MAKRRGTGGLQGGSVRPSAAVRGAGMGWCPSVCLSIHPSTHVQASRRARVIYQRGRGKESVPIISGVRLGS